MRMLVTMLSVAAAALGCAADPQCEETDTGAWVASCASGQPACSLDASGIFVVVQVHDRDDWSSTCVPSWRGPRCFPREEGMTPEPECAESVLTPRCEPSGQFDIPDCTHLSRRCLEAHGAAEASFGYYRCFGPEVENPDVELEPRG